MVMERRHLARRVTDRGLTDAEHEAAVNGIMEAKLEAYGRRKGWPLVLPPTRPVESKRCGRCRQEFSLDLFGANRARADGRAYCCRACQVIINAERYVRRKAELAEAGRPALVQDLAS